MPDHTRRHSSAIRAALAALFLLALSHTHTHAQAPQAMRDARRTDMIVRQRALHDLDKMKQNPHLKPPVTRLAYREAAEEFRQLQLVNYSLAGAADPKAALDYARVRKESGEVRKRASRLKEYLSLPEVEKQERGAEIRTPEALREAVGRLDALVNSFVWNPVLQKPDVVDLEQSMQASRDLAGIIILSDLIRRGADELGKSLAKK
jgi:hypothetical protein